MQSPSYIKIFCGADNDILRMQRNWECYAVGVIDIQDMFNVWKLTKWDRCLSSCYETVKVRLSSKKKGTCVISRVEIEQWLKDYQKPGMDFLMDVLLKEKGVEKNKSITCADWRVRPLHLDMLRYAAMDSFYALKIFYILYAEVKIF